MKNNRKTYRTTLHKNFKKQESVPDVKPACEHLGDRILLMCVDENLQDILNACIFVITVLVGVNMAPGNRMTVIGQIVEALTTGAKKKYMESGESKETRTIYSLTDKEKEVIDLMRK